MAPWIISIAIVFILLRAAYQARDRASNSFTVEGATIGTYLSSGFAVAALAFILVAVLLAK